jgi:hypothetical protein
MSDEGRKKKPPRTLETPMMPANMPGQPHPTPGPEANVVIAQPEPKNYVHPGKPPGMSTGLIVMMSIAAALIVVAVVVGILIATGHLAIQ